MSSKIHTAGARLSHDDKVQFWAIFTTAMVGLFSFWLGVCIQDDINTKNARETQKLARYQMVEAVLPRYSQYIDTGGYVFLELLGFSNSPSCSPSTVGDYYRQDPNAFIDAMDCAVNTMCEDRYFFGKQAQAQVIRNNVAILFGKRLLEPDGETLHRMNSLWRNASYADSMDLELYNPTYANTIISNRAEAVKGMEESCRRFWKEASTTTDSNSLTDLVVYHFLFLPYIDHFRLYNDELIPTDDVTSHLGQHIVMLLACIIAGALLCYLLLAYVFGLRVEKKEREQLSNNSISIP